MDLDNHPIKLTVKAGRLSKRFEDKVFTNYTYGITGNVNETSVQINDSNFNVIAEHIVPLSMKQFYEAIGDLMDKSKASGQREPLDLTADGVKQVQQDYADDAGIALREGHIKKRYSGPGGQTV